MATWYLNRALSGFRAAVNAAYPGRDKTSDGTIGDAAHQAGASDHNPDADGSVDAWDMDVDLRSGRDAAAIEALKRVFEAHESSLYWIHGRQIASRDTGWKRTAYSGPSPHTEHVHWNTRSSHETSTAAWPLEDTMTPDQFLAALKDPRVAAQLRALPWQYPVTPQLSMLNALAGPTGLIAQTAQLSGQVAGLASLVQELAAQPATQLTPEQLAELASRVEAAARAGATELGDRLASAARAEADALDGTPGS